MDLAMGHGHGHGHSANSDRRYLAAALALLVVFMAAEVVVGVIANSIALISEPGTCSPTPPPSRSR